jgi:hypothetical protein
VNCTLHQKTDDRSALPTSHSFERRDSLDSNAAPKNKESSQPADSQQTHAANLPLVDETNASAESRVSTTFISKYSIFVTLLGRSDSDTLQAVPLRPLQLYRKPRSPAGAFVCLRKTTMVFASESFGLAGHGAAGRAAASLTMIPLRNTRSGTIEGIPRTDQ